MTLTHPVAKPLRADAARNRARVLEAAEKVFADAGQEAQMEDVARRAGVGVGTLYRHFPTKQKLAEAVLERQIDALAAFIAAECATDPDPWAGLTRVFRRAAQDQAANRGQADALLSLADDLPDRCCHRVRLGPPTGAILARAQAQGLARPEVTEEDLHTLFCGLSAVTRTGGDWERYLEIVLTGVRV